MVSLSNDVKREIGQHFVCGFHGYHPSDEIKTLIRDYYLGNVILMKRNVQDAKQVQGLVRELQLLAKESGHVRPLLVGIDQENGLVSAFSSPAAGTQFPGAMALAATGDPDLAYQISAATAKELKAVGINWVYSPVADINSDSKNPVIGVRSYGDNPKQVTQYALSVAQGLASNRVAPAAKHFPGHGDTHVDSHLALPVINKSEPELQGTELIPFISLINDSTPIASVMVGHMALPGFTGDDTPASLSAKVTRGLLREQLSYDGVIVTDCLEMDAIAEPLQGGCGVEEGALRSLSAGADIAMICHTFESHVGSFKKVYAAVEEAQLDYAALGESGKRIAKMKDVYAGSWEYALCPVTPDAFQRGWDKLKEANLQLSKKAYQKSTTVVWGAEKLPLKAGVGKRVLLFTPTMESLNRAVDDLESVQRDRSGRLRNTAGSSYLALANEVQKHAVNTKHIVYSSDEDAEKIVDNVGAIVFVFRNADRSAWQIRYVKDLLTQVKEDIPVVLLASCGPYDLVSEDNLRRRTSFVASYEFTREAFDAFVGVVFAGNQAQGQLPVSFAGVV
ncbi:hypothetical protein H0H93_001714 [Arthromyces matolae]|nr:hypothetical protein H0H93_001714 [Arthromyces matolae]